MTDGDSLHRHKWDATRSCLHLYMHVYAAIWSSVIIWHHDGWLLLHRVLGLHHAAPLLLSLCQLVLFSCWRVILSLLENPQFLLTFSLPEKRDCRPQAFWTDLWFPKACVAQLIDFFYFYTLCLFCQIASLTKNVKLFFTAQASIVLFLFYCLHLGLKYNLCMQINDISTFTPGVWNCINTMH